MIDLESIKTKGIITKPHFDSKFYKVGKAYYITQKIGDSIEETNAILYTISDNSLDFVSVNKHKSSHYIFKIEIEQVLYNKTTILPMQPDINYI